MKLYRIYIEDEDGKMTVALTEKGIVKTFDCVYAAEVYAKQIGLKSRYQIR